MAQTINRYDLRNTTVEKIDSCIKTLQEAIKDERSGVYGTPDQGKIKKWNDAIQTYKETKETTLAIHKAIEKNGYLNLLNGSKNAQSIAKMENALIQKGIRIEELDGLEKSKIKSQLIRDEDFEFDVGNDFGGDDGLLTKAGKKAGKDMLHGDNGKGFATGLCKALSIVSIAGFATSGIDMIFGANTVADMVGTALPNAFTFLGNAINALWTFNPLATVCLGTMVAIKAIPAIARFCNKAKMKIKGLTRSSDLAAKLRANVDYEGLANDYSKTQDENGNEPKHEDAQPGHTDGGTTQPGKKDKDEPTNDGGSGSGTGGTGSGNGSNGTNNNNKTKDAAANRKKLVDDIMKTFPAEMGEQEKEDAKQLVTEILEKLDDLKFQNKAVKELIDRNLDDEIYYSGMTKELKYGKHVDRPMTSEEIKKDVEYRKSLADTAKTEFENAKKEIEEKLQSLAGYSNIAGDLGNEIAKAINSFANNVKNNYNIQKAEFSVFEKEFKELMNSAEETFKIVLQEEHEQGKDKPNDITPEQALKALDKKVQALDGKYPNNVLEELAQNKDGKSKEKLTEALNLVNGYQKELNDIACAPQEKENIAEVIVAWKAQFEEMLTKVSENAKDPENPNKELEDKVKANSEYWNKTTSGLSAIEEFKEFEQKLNELNEKRFEILMDSVNYQKASNIPNPNIMLTLHSYCDKFENRLKGFSKIVPGYKKAETTIENIRQFAVKYHNMLQGKDYDKVLEEAKKDKVDYDKTKQEDLYDFDRTNQDENDLRDESPEEITAAIKNIYKSKGIQLSDNVKKYIEALNNSNKVIKGFDESDNKKYQVRRLGFVLKQLENGDKFSYYANNNDKKPEMVEVQLQNADEKDFIVAYLKMLSLEREKTHNKLKERDTSARYLYDNAMKAGDGNEALKNMTEEQRKLLEEMQFQQNK